ncbi:MAG TPA: hypothetical protein EYQ50_24690 [Verrucomicrobiales bacterium]|nr:hypothetical protein [Verrucomicrobiales bacterium]
MSFQVCPHNVLQPSVFEQGLMGIWTPQVNADWAGCDPSCNACTQVCPTGTIRAVPLEEKRYARMGLAIVNPTTCLPFAEKETYRLCVDECISAGYHAIDFIRVGTQLNDQGHAIRDSGFAAPVVNPARFVGCGLCQTACYHINAKNKDLLQGSAIVIKAGKDREDCILSGSYLELNRAVAKNGADSEVSPGVSESEAYLPDFLK